MFKRDIKFVNFDGEDETRSYYFTISERELVRLDAEYNGNLLKYLQGLQEKNNPKEIIDFFEHFVLMAYGVRDGDRFIKNDEVRTEFTQTAAWDALFMELATEDGAILKFFMAVLPENMREQIANGLKEQAKTATEIVASSAPRPPAPVPPAS